MNYKPKIEFDEECLQDVAESHIGRTLTKKEYEDYKKLAKDEGFGYKKGGKVKGKKRK